MEEERKLPVGTENSQRGSAPCDAEMNNGEVRVMPVLCRLLFVVTSGLWWCLLCIIPVKLDVPGAAVMCDDRTSKSS